MPRWSLRKSFLLVGVGLVSCGLLNFYWNDGSPIAIENDPQPPFQIDPDQPYEISYFNLGLPGGSEKEVVVQHNGQVTLKESKYVRRQSESYREDRTASFTILPDARAKILRAITTHRVMELQRRYELKNTFDGFHTRLVIRQGTQEKRVGCSNYTPDEFTKFRNELFAMTELSQADVNWQTTKIDRR